ncbi:hypothetical protein HDU92_000894 [Lobulomyces angularis]|nr:hypothetical protein HDU92_000894 [Lobulomyces angularis]
MEKFKKIHFQRESVAETGNVDENKAGFSSVPVSVNTLYRNLRQDINIREQKKNNKVLEETLFLEVSVTKKLSHFTSISHQFEKSKVETEITETQEHLGYKFTPKDRGYQMLINGGWEIGNGLGSLKSGRINPVTVKLKRNKHGIGLKRRRSESDIEDITGKGTGVSRILNYFYEY